MSTFSANSMSSNDGELSAKARNAAAPASPICEEASPCTPEIRIQNCANCARAQVASNEYVESPVNEDVSVAMQLY